MMIIIKNNIQNCINYLICGTHIYFRINAAGLGKSQYAANCWSNRQAAHLSLRKIHIVCDNPLVSNYMRVETVSKRFIITFIIKTNLIDKKSKKYSPQFLILENKRRDV